MESAKKMKMSDYETVAQATAAVSTISDHNTAEPINAVDDVVVDDVVVDDVIVDNVVVDDDDVNIMEKEKILHVDTVDEQPSLNEDQQQFLNSYLAIIDAGDVQPVFVSGNAGTGKTFLLKRLYEELSERRDMNTEKIAMSAIAARNIDGITLHRLFMFGFNGEYNTRYTSKIVRQMEALIVDEVSMINAMYLDNVDKILKTVKCQPNIPFGGVHVIVFGDLYQLPPVMNDNKLGNQQCFLANVWKHFKLFTLNKMMRQNEKDFIEALNCLRVGDDNGIAFFNRLRVTQHQFDPMEASTLVSTNKAAATLNDRNNVKILLATDKKHTIESTTKNGYIKDTRYLYSADNIYQIIPKSITLGVGSRIIVTHNCNKSSCINGDLGVVEDFGCNAQGNVVSIYFRKTNDTLCVLKEEVIVFKNKESDKKNVAVFRIGFPINLAWAMTIHKMQGVTLDRLRVPLDYMFAPGQLYVALSRVKTSQGLQLLQNITKNMLRFDENVAKAYETMPRFGIGDEVEESDVKNENTIAKIVQL
ncbi:helicase-2 [Lambdina fiscellaria nucleopolyhedrovirus]|uniref:Helicase-2 n=1 Tax=Lambdina fiscellaria nucleopolyhedrovirus TaxID=1642929 RepID=A0A0E3Z7F6_9ABAC|nr:helicase-2 [Lambdina fiscellaria nucleopolyhedrovirus]AKC91702.1 helicase-2 [Lambdina fiscellaria nucleopolyhedrovirus]